MLQSIRTTDGGCPVRQLPPLNALRVFEAAARRGSFTAAACELHVTQSAISQQIRLIEDRLNVALFRRTPRGVALTKVGEQYLASVQSIFDDLVEATELVRNATIKPLRICSLPTFGTRWLAPRLPSFQEAYPEIEITLNVSLNWADFEQDDIDVAIIHGRPPWPRLAACLILVQHITPVCHPELLEGPKAIRCPADICNHTLLHVVREANEWNEWLKAAGVRSVDAQRSLNFDSTKMTLDAAMNGLGVAMGRQPFVIDELQDGRLVAPFPLQLQSESAYYLAYPEDMKNRPEIGIFQDWMLSEIRQTVGG